MSKESMKKNWITWFFLALFVLFFFEGKFRLIAGFFLFLAIAISGGLSINGRQKETEKES